MSFTAELCVYVKPVFVETLAFLWSLLEATGSWQVSYGKTEVSRGSCLSLEQRKHLLIEELDSR